MERESSRGPGPERPAATDERLDRSDFAYDALTDAIVRASSEPSTLADAPPPADQRDDPERWRRIATLAFWHLVPLVPFVALSRYLERRALLTEDAYRRPVIAWEWLVSLPIVEVVLLAVLVAAIVWLRSPFEPWSAWTDGRTLRFVVGVPTTALAWWFATADVNLFIGRSHLVDRLLIVALAAAVWWRPVFVLPFLVVVLAFDGQFHHPLGRHSIAQISLPSNLLFLFAAAYLVQVVARRSMARHFVFLTLCMVAASYLAPGLAKLRLGWLGHRNVHLVVFSSHSVGWLGTTSASTIETIGRWMEVVEWPIVIGTIVVECGAIILLLRRSTAIAWLGMFVALNTMILLTTGIFFWTWIVINSALLLIVLTHRDAPAFDVFSTLGFLISLPVIAFGSILFRPIELAWLDAPVNYTYQLEATTESGERVRIATSALAPFDTQFAIGDLGHVSQAPNLGIAWGAVHDRELAAALLDVRTPEELWDIEREYGAVTFDPDAARDFDRFVREVVRRWNADHSRNVAVLGWIPTPRQVWLSSDAASEPPDEIVGISVRELVAFFDGDEYEVVRDRVVREIPITPGV